jgi:hypothetical protein
MKAAIIWFVFTSSLSIIHSSRYAQHTVASRQTPRPPSDAGQGTSFNVRGVFLDRLAVDAVVVCVGGVEGTVGHA